jgi:hypothetical protein
MKSERRVKMKIFPMRPRINISIGVCRLNYAVALVSAAIFDSLMNIFNENNSVLQIFSEEHDISISFSILRNRERFYL